MIATIDGAEQLPEVHFRTIHGYRRAYRVCGSGPAVLLLHGISDNSASWAPVMAALGRRHTVIAPDLLGHGESDKPRADYSVAAFANGMRDLLDVLDVPTATVVGHSLGGGVAAQLAYQYPDRCDRLVLVSTGGVARQVSPVLRAAAVPLSEVAMLPLRLPGVPLVARVALEAAGRLGADVGVDAPEIQRVLRGLPEASARGAFTRTLRAVVDWRGQLVTMLDRAYLAESMPVLIIWGDRDAIIPVEHAHLAHQMIRGSGLSVFPGAGHFPHHADPERFVSELEAFIDGTEPFRHDLDHRKELLRRGAIAPDEPREPALIG